MTSSHAEKCCYLVSENEASALFDQQGKYVFFSYRERLENISEIKLIMVE